MAASFTFIGVELFIYKKEGKLVLYYRLKQQLCEN